MEIVSAVALSLGTCLAGAADKDIAASASPAETLDEVVVSGARLRELRAAAIKAEDRVVALYNELNQDDDLDIECLRYTPTGTRISYRYCLTRLQKRARQEDASDFMGFMHNADVLNGARAPNPETGVRLMTRSDEYRKNLASLLQDNPDLRELVKQSGDAMRRYEAASGSRVRGDNRSEAVGTDEHGEWQPC